MTESQILVLVRRAALTVYGVDPAERSASARHSEARGVAMMALHDEFKWTRMRAAGVFGRVPSTFTYARRRLVKMFDADDQARARAARFLQIVDAHLAGTIV